MPDVLRRLTRRLLEPGIARDPAYAPEPAGRAVALELATKLAVDSPGAPGWAGAEALYQKWSARWQEF